MKIEAAPLSFGRALAICLGLFTGMLVAMFGLVWWKAPGPLRSPLPDDFWGKVLVVLACFLVVSVVGAVLMVWRRKRDRRQHWELEGAVIRMYQDGALVAEVPVARVARLAWRKQNLFLWTREGAVRRLKFKFRGVGWESYQALRVALGLRKYRASWVGRWLGSWVRR